MANDIADTAWRKSSFSGDNGNCVEIRPVAAGIAVRDSKRPDGTVLEVSRDDWHLFLAKIKN